MGVSGKAIVNAILSGERDAKVLASLVKTKLQASPEEIRKSLVGFWKESHLFELRQNYDAYEFHRKQLEQCDEKLNEQLQKLVEKTIRRIYILILKVGKIKSDIKIPQSSKLKIMHIK